MTTPALTLTWKRDASCWKTPVVDHGVKDAKGRAIGGRIAIEARWNYHVPGQGWVESAPEMFFVYSYATRDGKDFGATPTRGPRFSTLALAQAAAVKTLTAQRARYQKLAARGEGSPWAKPSAS